MESGHAGIVASPTTCHWSQISRMLIGPRPAKVALCGMFMPRRPSHPSCGESRERCTPSQSSEQATERVSSSEDFKVIGGKDGLLARGSTTAVFMRSSVHKVMHITEWTGDTGRECRVFCLLGDGRVSGVLTSQDLHLKGGRVNANSIFCVGRCVYHLVVSTIAWGLALPGCFGSRSEHTYVLSRRPAGVPITSFLVVATTCEMICLSETFLRVRLSGSEDSMLGARGAVAGMGGPRRQWNNLEPPAPKSNYYFTPQGRRQVQ